MLTIKQSQVEETITVCPYCMEEREEHGVGCCGESSAHFETAVVYEDMAYLENEINILEGE